MTAATDAEKLMSRVSGLAVCFGFGRPDLLPKFERSVMDQRWVEMVADGIASLVASHPRRLGIFFGRGEREAARNRQDTQVCLCAG